MELGLAPSSYGSISNGSNSFSYTFLNGIYAAEASTDDGSGDNGGSPNSCQSQSSKATVAAGNILLTPTYVTARTITTHFRINAFALTSEFGQFFEFMQ
jgi:hypothetical protein